MSDSNNIQLERNAWTIGVRINEGGFAEVYRTTSDGLDGEFVAKIVPKVPGAERELLFVDLNGRPNVMPIVDKGETEDSYVLIMPLAEMSLADHLSSQAEPITSEMAVTILKDIFDGLVGLNGEVVHRDVKPENILLYEGKWCLADFGIARYADASTDADTRKFAWTPEYAAPEQWRFERVTPASDIYSTGILAYEMAEGETPFLGPTVEEFREQHLRVVPPAAQNATPALASIITECLYKPPEARPTAERIRARLEGSLERPTGALGRLQDISQNIEQELAEQSGRDAADLTESERRDSLYVTATQSFDEIMGQMFDSIKVNAPACQASALPHSTASSGWEIRLADAKLGVSPCQQLDHRVPENYDPPLDVIAMSAVVLEIPLDRHEYEGRSHSLWYCDAQEEGVYRWYEVAFMHRPSMGRRGRKDPFALAPGSGGIKAISAIMGVLQAAWPFSPIDQGNEDEFIERWISWLADAAEGKLSYPSRMPERDPKDSWRIR